MSNYIMTGVGKKNSIGAAVCRAIKNKDADANIYVLAQPYIKPDADVQGVIHCDLSDTNQAYYKTINILSHFGVDKVDGFIHCAGINKICDITGLSMKEFDVVMAVNATCTLRIMQALMDSGNKNFDFLNVISKGADYPYTSGLAYNASKACLKMMTMQMGKELKKSHNINVIGVSPTQVAGTEMTKESNASIAAVRGWSPEEVLLNQQASSASGKMVNVNDLGEFIAGIITNKSHCDNLCGSILNYGTGV